MTNEEMVKVVVENIEPLVSIAKWLFGLVMAAFIAAIFWSWKLSSLFHSFKTTLTSLETKFDALEGRFDSLDKRMTSTESYLHKLCGFLGNDAPQFDAFTQTNSPITLTPHGEDLVRDSGFNDFAKAHKTLWESIADAARDRPDAEAYIEKNAFKAVHELFDDDDPRVAQVSLYMFEHGLRHDDHIYDAVLRSFGVVARDEAFKIAGFKIPVSPQRQASRES